MSCLFSDLCPVYVLIILLPIINGSLSGEILGLLGPSGAGKSSSLRLIAGVTKPTAGEVVKNEETVSIPKIEISINIDHSFVWLCFES